MAWTQTDLDTLDAAIVNGVRKVTFADGRSTEYQNVADMRLVRNDMKAELIAARGSTAPRTTVGRICRR